MSNAFLASFLPPELADRSEVVVALAAVVLSLLWLLLSALLRGGSRGGKTVVISGPCNGGKTCLFHQLMGSGVVDTVASMQENEGMCQVPSGGSARIVDVPGHERLRHKLDRYLQDAKCVTRGGALPHALPRAQPHAWPLVYPVCPIPRARVPLALPRAFIIPCVPMRCALRAALPHMCPMHCPAPVACIGNNNPGLPFSASSFARRAVIFVLDSVDVTPHKAEVRNPLRSQHAPGLQRRSQVTGAGLLSLQREMNTSQRRRRNTSPLNSLCTYPSPPLLPPPSPISPLQAAEELFEILTNASIARRRVPLLIACNKMDLETQAHSLDFIRWDVSGMRGNPCISACPAFIG